LGLALCLLWRFPFLQALPLLLSLNGTAFGGLDRIASFSDRAKPFAVAPSTVFYLFIS
jgi:hypothetical protein